MEKNYEEADFADAVKFPQTVSDPFESVAKAERQISKIAATSSARGRRRPGAILCGIAGD